MSLAPIAERAGVSRMTVSRVLRGEAIVLPQTRDRVLRIARDLGYRPNPLVRALMAQRRAGGAASASTVEPTASDWKG